MKLQDISTSFSFTEDTPHYWEGFWEMNPLRGGGAADPDAKSPTLKEYHRLLWSKELPNGDYFALEDGRSWSYLKTSGETKADDRAFGSDSIIVSLRQRLSDQFLIELKNSKPDYHRWLETFVHDTYTIGGMILFPQIRWSMNQARGCSRKICDRWDLTMECIRRYYVDGLQKDNPLYSSLSKDRNREFFDAFVDFKGYVDFFFLQDCVTPDYSRVKLWLSSNNPLPQTVEEYWHFIHAQLDFLEKRNRRINDYISQSNQ